MAEEFTGLSPEDIAGSRRREELPKELEVTRRVQLPPAQVGKPSPGKASLSDILGASAAQGILGVTADVPGFPGDIASIGSRVLPEPYAGYAKGLGAYLPTSQKIEEFETQKLPFLGYKGESPEARKIAGAARAGTSMAAGPGGLLPAAGRFAIGYGATRTAQELAPGLAESGSISPEYQQYVEPALATAATVFGMKYGPTAGKMMAPGVFAQKEAAEALAKDVRSGLFDIEGYKEAQKSGVVASPADYAREGSSLRSLIEEQGGLTPAGRSALDEYKASILAQPGTRVKGRFQEAYDQTKQMLEKANSGQPIQVADLEEYLRDSGKHVRDSVYNLAKISPQAGAIDFASLGTYQTATGATESLARHPLLMESVYDVTKNSASYDPKYGIIPPKPITLANGQQATSPGNIAFWDMVKRDLDQKARNSFSKGNDQDVIRGQSYQFARNQLVDRLDNIVPGYGIARNKAAETFGSESAPAAGMMFYGKMDAFDAQAAKNAYQAMTPDQRDLFKTGWLAAMQGDLQRKEGFAKIADQMILPGDFQENARMVLGNNFDAIRGSIIGNNAKMTARAFSPTPAPAGERLLKTVGKAGALSGGIVALTDLLTEAAFQASVVGGKVAAGTAAFAGMSKAKSAAERFAANRVANKLVPMLLSEDPRVMANLSKMMDRDPRIANTISRLNMITQASQQPRLPPVVEQYEVSQEGESAVPVPEFGRRARATGGRIGMTAERLLSMLEGAKRSVQKDTEALLQEPDEKIAKALTIAKEGI